jgi:peptidoglycan/xylan/chitin deacetylase (PgdA/CDA1 family)
MYAKLAKTTKTERDTVYLTFDDGPSKRTAEILDILKKENIKATFFIIGKEGAKEKELFKRITEEGHTIGIHTYSHVYDNIYDSVENYLEDFYLTYQLIYETTGIKPEVFRFPGGSINKYSAPFYEEIIAEMTRRGFTYYDWNASSGDANANATAVSVYNSSVQSSADKNRVILLMHDSINRPIRYRRFPALSITTRQEAFNFNESLTM